MTTGGRWSSLSRPRGFQDARSSLLNHWGVLSALLLLLSSGIAPPSYAADAAPAARPTVGHTRVFAHVGSPGYPAYAFVRRDGRVFAGTYTGREGSSQVDQAGVPSKVFEYSRRGRLLRSFTVPGQDLQAEHGVQVANQTRYGRVVVLETSTASILTLDPRTGHWRRIARLPAGTVPNYASWGPGGVLYVTDFDHGTIWRLGRDRVPRRWFTSPALDGAGFGTTGIVYRPGHHDLLVTQQTATDGASPPTDGHLYRLPVRADGRPGTLATLWTSRPGDLPDGFGISRSGHVYVALAGLANQLVELSGAGRELRRFGTALTGANGSTVPFDTPCSATFLGTEVLVANQSAVAGDPANHAVLAVQVGERGAAPFVPRGASFATSSPVRNGA